jgi:hypothetical protein
MLKHLTFLVVAGLVANTGCIITTNTSGSDSASDTSKQTTETPDTVGTTDTTGGTTDSTDGTTDSTDGTTDSTDTGVPTTGVPTTTDATTADTDSTTTTGGGFGQCGWDGRNNYYACGGEGEDPEGIDPIQCPDPLPNAGDPCDEETSLISGIGCCLPDGTNYYCSQQGIIVIEECGA